MTRPRRSNIRPRLLEFRQRAQLTQEQVAELIGITPEMVRRHEHGLSRPIAKYRERYTQLFRATEEQLGFQANGNSPSASSAVAEDIGEIMARVNKLESGAVGTDTLRCLEIAI